MGVEFGADCIEVGTPSSAGGNGGNVEKSGNGGGGGSTPDDEVAVKNSRCFTSASISAKVWLFG